MLINRIEESNINTDQTNLNSAAIQDHFMKNFKLGSIDPFKKKKVFGGISVASAARPPRATNQVPTQLS